MKRKKRLAVLICGGLVLIIAALSTRHFWFYKPVHLVPMRQAFLGHGIHCTQFWQEHYHADDPHYWYATNMEDPNIRGYDALRRIFLLEIAAVLGNLPVNTLE